jgi:hypothetical protein
LDLQLPAQSVPITTNVVSLNSADGEVYSIENDVIKFVNDLRQVMMAGMTNNMCCLSIHENIYFFLKTTMEFAYDNMARVYVRMIVFSTTFTNISVIS